MANLNIIADTGSTNVIWGNTRTFACNTGNGYVAGAEGPVALLCNGTSQDMNAWATVATSGSCVKG